MGQSRIVRTRHRWGRRLGAIAVAVPMFAAFNVASASAKGGPGTKPVNKPTINFKQTTYTVAEGGNASIGLTRNGGTADSTVKVNTAGGGAVGGNPCIADTTPPDYISGPYTATFTGSHTTATVLIHTCNDHAYTGNRTVQLTLSDFTNGQGGSKVTALLTIVEDEPSPHVSVTGGSANEGSPVNFTVSRTGTSPNPTSLHYTTSPVTAIAGTNYTTTSG